MALCPGLPGWAGTRKVKPIWIRDSEWQWQQLGHTQVCISLQTDNHASTPPFSFLQAGCPSCRPTNSVKALKARLLYMEAIYEDSHAPCQGMLVMMMTLRTPVQFSSQTSSMNTPMAYRCTEVELVQFTCCE